MSTYTPETLSAALDLLDERVKTGILEGNIEKVMDDITSELVSENKNSKIYTTYVKL